MEKEIQSAAGQFALKTSPYKNKLLVNGIKVLGL